MEIVLPLSVHYRRGAHSDLLRLKTLLQSVEKFWRSDGVLRIITPDGDEVSAEVERLALDVPVAVHTDDEVLPGLSTALRPWWRQQCLKLAVSRSIVCSDFYLTLDADCFFVRETNENDLVIGGSDGNRRGKVCFDVPNYASQKRWYRGCSKLGLEIPTRSVNTTPFVFNTALARRAFEFVSTNSGGQNGAGLSPQTNGKNRTIPVESIGKLGWSEYTLYHCLALRDGAWDTHHVEAAPLLGNAVWLREDLETWSPATLHEGFLSLVQSATGATAAWVRERLSTG